jgi:hypothetical protein
MVPHVCGQHQMKEINGIPTVSYQMTRRSTLGKMEILGKDTTLRRKISAFCVKTLKMLVNLNFK